MRVGHAGVGREVLAMRWSRVFPPPAAYRGGKPETPAFGEAGAYIESPVAFRISGGTPPLYPGPVGKFERVATTASSQGSWPKSRFLVRSCPSEFLACCCS